VEKIMVAVPAEFKVLAESMTAMVELLSQQVAAQRAGTVGYAQFERFVEDRAGAIESAMHKIALAALDADAERVSVNGVEYSRCLEKQPANYGTRTGFVEVPRNLFRKVGERAGPTVDLVALRSGALDGRWLPEAAASMAYLLQESPSRVAAASARNLGRLPYAPSSFEEVGHLVSQRYVSAEKSIDDTLVRNMELPAELASVSAALDRVNVPIAEPLPRPVGRPRKGAAKKPIKVVYHMAYCGTVTLHDAEGRALHTIRYGCMPVADAESLVDGMAGDVLVLRQRRRDLPVALLSDGAPEMHHLLDDAFTGDEYGVAVRLIDFWHLVEKLGEALKVIAPEKERIPMLRRWQIELRNRRDARASILEQLVASGKEDVHFGEDRPVHDAITYLQNNAERMDYIGALRRHLPIGSGAVEATCKCLVGTRMHRTGARWNQRTADLVVHLRALALSDRWGDAMRLTLYTPPVAVRALKAA
jgi:hypothetical protein